MFEPTASIETRDAIQAGRKARADALAQALELIFGRRPR